MNKEEFTAVLSQKAGISRLCAQRTIDAFGEILAEELAAGGIVQLRRLGTFSTVTRPARLGSHPRTSTPLQIKESKSVRFAAGSVLRARI